eukprot:3426530-Rhodomonas_salina.2
MHFSAVAVQSVPGRRLLEMNFAGERHCTVLKRCCVGTLCGLQSATICTMTCAVWAVIEGGDGDAIEACPAVAIHNSTQGVFPLCNAPAPKLKHDHDAMSVPGLLILLAWCPFLAFLALTKPFFCRGVGYCWLVFVAGGCAVRY